MIQFYSSDIQNTLTLGAEESHHCIKVLRKKAGDMIQVTDGKGNRYECRITCDNPKKVEVEILSSEKVQKSWPHKISLVIAPPKNNDRISWLVEKCVEIGIDEIVFVRTDRSERKVVNRERILKVAISAMNQSLKTYLPVVADIVPLSEFLSTYQSRQGVVGYCEAESERKEFENIFNPALEITVFIGPEGDFTEEEIQSLKERDVTPVTFGRERLRTETAAIYGVCGAHVLYNYKK